jgi:hypothetical protein
MQSEPFIEVWNPNTQDWDSIWTAKRTNAQLERERVHSEFLQLTAATLETL